VTNILSQTNIEIDGIPQHVRDVRVAPGSYVGKVLRADSINEEDESDED
jgi:hypothetical protein